MNFFWNVESKTKASLSLFSLSNNVMFSLKRFSLAWEAFGIYARFHSMSCEARRHDRSRHSRNSATLSLDVLQQESRNVLTHMDFWYQKEVSSVAYLYRIVLFGGAAGNNTIRICSLLPCPNTEITVFPLLKCILWFCTLTQLHTNTRVYI
jgi:hypothetical protein